MLTLTNKEYKALAKRINRELLGLKGLITYKTLYGTTIETWGRRDCSAWIVTYHRNQNGTIRSIEVHRKYFARAAKIADTLNEKLEQGLPLFEN